VRPNIAAVSATIAIAAGGLGMDASLAEPFYVVRWDVIQARTIEANFRVATCRRRAKEHQYR
jgi:hypothetical protein